MTLHYCRTFPCPVCTHPTPIMGGSWPRIEEGPRSFTMMSTTFRLHERFTTWREAVDFVAALGDVTEKSTIRREVHALGACWRVSYAPRLVAYNHTSAAS